MPALSGSASFRRFFSTPLQPEQTRERLRKAVSAHKFIPTTEVNTFSYGWVPMRDPFEDNTDPDLFMGDFIILGFRVDDRVIKATDVRDELKLRVKAVQEEKGRLLSKPEKKQLKESIMAEMRAKAPIRRRVAELVWDTANNEVRVFGAPKSLMSVCSELFEKTFGICLEEANIESIARRKGLTASLGEDTASRFMTWLWYNIGAGERFGNSNSTVRAYVGATLKSVGADGSEVRFRGEQSAECEELLTALKNNHLITSYKLHLAVGDEDIPANLDAKTLSLTGCKLPKNPPLQEEEEAPEGEEQQVDRAALEDEARLLYRMGFLQQAQDALDNEVAAFLQLTASEVAAWMHSVNGMLAEKLGEAA